jgi:elongator complex protein 2
MRIPVDAALDEDNFVDEPSKFAPAVLTSPPLEEHLLQSTLWPEIMKLYGHGNEIIAVCCSNNGGLIASSCKGTTPETSAIRLWDTKTWKECGILFGHSLTVAQMAFSHNDEVLLSVSRDRAWCAYTRNHVGSYQLAASQNKAHARILWGCAWAHDDNFFVTVSRDKGAKVWRRESWALACELAAPTKSSR